MRDPRSSAARESKGKTTRRVTFDEPTCLECLRPLATHGKGYVCHHCGRVSVALESGARWVQA